MLACLHAPGCRLILWVHIAGFWRCSRRTSSHDCSLSLDGMGSTNSGVPLLNYISLRVVLLLLVLLSHRKS